MTREFKKHMIDGTEKITLEDSSRTVICGSLAVHQKTGTRRSRAKGCTSSGLSEVVHDFTIYDWKTKIY
jgi:hypothetical protein